ncbi:uncharacterized protein Z520_07163 [Fonsecaea multimorphosa CBS 102226]|uniref:Uncharacterized protein n=1 Tax=Fonsecaea multimorphosa CBS 102226 TaxID=1442371 RepID=A0A0D2K1Z8_9EURO|nr:uncharacterized protein Z520_07163 [Fonsecaea multimorphosa CBS 102226]KIX97049.1 hypothetical protein Z520_07163 [Fonsecaea multimorphosa CBS 102226]
MLLSKSSEYSDVRLDDEEIIINHPENRVCKGPWPYLPWALAIFLSLLLIRNIWGQSEESRERQAWGSYEAGFATDIDQTRPLIRLKQVQFYGSFRVNDEGIWHLSRNDSEPVYVGKPSPEIDLAWDALIIPRFAGLYREDAERLGLTLSGDDYEHDRIWIEPSGYHDLHCLNYIRRALDREYYTEIVFDRTTPVMPGMASDRLHLGEACLSEGELLGP